MENSQSPNHRKPASIDGSPPRTPRTPTKLSDLLVAFGASPSPTSVSKMRKEMQQEIDEASRVSSETTSSFASLPKPPTPEKEANAETTGTLISEGPVTGNF